MTDLFFDEGTKRVTRFSRVAHKAKGGKGGCYLLFGGFDSLCAVEHDLAQHVAQVTAGQRGIADEGNSVGREELVAECEQAVPHRLRHPGVNTVRNDVVKPAELGACFEQIALKESDVSQAERSNTLLPALHRQIGQVEADEFTFWDGIGHGDEVRAFVAGDFEHAASVDRRGREAVQDGHGGEMVWVGIGI